VYCVRLLPGAQPPLGKGLQLAGEWNLVGMQLKIQMQLNPDTWTVLERLKIVDRGSSLDDRLTEIMHGFLQSLRASEQYTADGCMYCCAVFMEGLRKHE
jgi:hypothetical protein